MERSRELVSACLKSYNKLTRFVQCNFLSAPDLPNEEILRKANLSLAFLIYSYIMRKMLQERIKNNKHTILIGVGRQFQQPN